jgi:hypothetical protein
MEEAKREDFDRWTERFEIIQPWLNPVLWKKIQERNQVRKNILESDEFRELGGWYMDENGKMHHPLMEDDPVKPEKKDEKPFEPSFGPMPTEN